MLGPALLCSMLVPGSAAHVFYSVIGGEDGPGVGVNDVSIELIWGEWNEVGDVFASCEVTSSGAFHDSALILYPYCRSTHRLDVL